MASQGRLESPRVAARGVVPGRLPMVEADGHREEPGAREVCRQGRRQSDAGREQLDRHVAGRMRRDLDDVRVQQRLAARETQPGDPGVPEIVDHLEDGGGVHGHAGALLVVAVLAVLGAGVGETYLGVRRTGTTRNQMMADEPRVRAAGERR